MTNPPRTESSVQENHPPGSKTAKAKETISFLSTAVPLLGVLGTVFVWVAANYYVGTVDIKPADDYQKITVQVYDPKGGEKVFHTPHFLLQPGTYHFAIQLDEKNAQHVDADVKLGSTANIKVAASAPAASTDDTQSAKEENKKHWWQIWKKSEKQSSETDTPDTKDSK